MKIDSYRGFLRKKWLVLLALLVLLLGSSAVSLSVGNTTYTAGQIISALFAQENSPVKTILLNIRLPRIGAGIAVGVALAAAGCVMQNVLRNPLASASTLGVSQGASFGAAFAIVILGAGLQTGGSGGTLTVTEPYLVALFAFLGGMATTAVVFLLSRMTGVSPSGMVLAGVALSSLFTGATTLIQYFADDVLLSTVVYWTFGSLSRAGWQEIGLIFLLDVLAMGYFLWNRWNYNAMESGSHTAKSLGVPVEVLTIISMTLCALICAVSVAFVGCISFVGLIAPHIARRFLGNDHRFLIPGSALLGGILMVLAEILTRMIAPPVVLPIGALTSILGAPLFLALILRGGKRG